MGNISYFLGCSSPEGFHSFFGELCSTHSGGYTYIIKGGPGTGKSSLMKRINSALTDAGIETELIYCSSDPASLDGVYAPALNCWIADGTSPHTLEPKYPGAAQETVDLGRFWNKDILRSRADEVIALDDAMDDMFIAVKDDLIELIRQDGEKNGDQAITLMMVAKYLERIGDHAVNVAEWTKYNETGVHQKF